MCLSHFLYFENKRTSSSGTTKWVEKPLNLSCGKFNDFIEINRMPYNILLMKNDETKMIHTL